MNEREEIINRLNALELCGGSHEMLSSIAKAISPDAMFGWTIGSCNLLRARLVNLLSDDEAYQRGFDEGYASADDWLAEHEDEMAEHGFVRLPKDADGEVIHIGDDMETLIPAVKGEHCKVEYIALTANGWEVDGDTPDSMRHHKQATVEDLLRDMHAKLDEVTALYVGEAIDSDERDSDEARIFAEYAAKLQLRGDAE